MAQKNIVLCSDGTGQRGGPGRSTNVWRTYLAVDTADPTTAKGPQQVRFHDDGVGSQDFLVFKIIGGAFGFGLSRNLRDLYASLMMSYEEGDKVFLFGFSRGAYTMRILAQLITLFGIKNGRGKSPRDVREIARSVLNEYKKRRATGVQPAAEGEFPVHFLGCWDTVDAVGLPFDHLLPFKNWLFPLRFANNDPPLGVRHLYHAVALGDERTSFHPEMWSTGNCGLVEGQTVEQVWFPGMHSNVGGGYPKDQLALKSLLWMLEKADNHGLRLHEHILQHHELEASTQGKVYDSRAGLGAFYRYCPRSVEELDPSEEPKIHAGALERIADQTDGYSPTSLDTKDFETIGDSSFSETPEDTQRRQEKLADARGHIGKQRVLYWLFLFWSLAFIGTGYWLSVELATWEPLRFLEKCVGAIVVSLLDIVSAILPGFLAAIFRGYQQFPTLLIMAALLLAALLVVSRKLLDAKRRAATRAWHPRQLDVQKRKTDGVVISKRLAFVTVLLLICVCIAWCKWDSYHSHELESDSDRPLVTLDTSQPEHELRFETSATYFPTGVFVQKGYRYHLEVDVQMDWEDLTIAATPDGFNNKDDEKPIHRWLKRVPDESVFTLMAAIGPDAENLERIGNGGEFEANASGPLYLFVNDVPGFYHNNKGSADITIKRIE